MIQDVQRRVAVVTGASRGIGLAITEALLKHGYLVACMARGMRNLELARNHCDPSGERTMILSCDVSNAEQVRASIDSVVSNWKRIDLLVNNAAVGFQGDVRNFTDEQWNKTQDTNLKGPFNCCREVIPIMERQLSGHIIMISTSSDRGNSPYLASKRGLEGFARSLGYELRDKGIRVSLIIPGEVDKSLYDFPGKPDLSGDSMNWFAVPAAEIANLVIKIAESAGNFWIREVSVSSLFGENRDSGVNDRRKEMHRKNAEILIPVFKPAMIRPDERINVSLSGRFSLSFYLDTGNSVTGFTPKESLFRVLREASVHKLGRAIFRGEDPSLYSDLVETIIFGRLHGIAQYGIITNGSGFQNKFFVDQLNRFGMTLWQISCGRAAESNKMMRAVLKNLADLQRGEVVLHYLVDGNNYKSLKETVRSFLKLREMCKRITSIVLEIVKPEETLTGRTPVSLKEAAPYIREAAGIADENNLTLLLYGFSDGLAAESLERYAVQGSDCLFNPLTREWLDAQSLEVMPLQPLQLEVDEKMLDEKAGHIKGIVEPLLPGGWEMKEALISGKVPNLIFTALCNEISTSLALKVSIASKKTEKKGVQFTENLTIWYQGTSLTESGRKFLEDLVESLRKKDQEILSLLER